VITPVVARLDAAGLEYRPDPHEVAAWFEAPLAVFADRAGAIDLGPRTHDGVTYRLRGYQVGTHRVWGATAGVMEQIVDLLGIA
jgi:hypothetical protein